MARGRAGQITGLREARETLQTLSKTVQRNVGRRALDAGADYFVGQIKALAPVSSRPSDPTPGSLKASVKRVKSNSRKRAESVILIEDEAAVPNEFGTSKMAAQPFARRAVDNHRDTGARVVAEALKVEVDTAAKRAAKRKKG